MKRFLLALFFAATLAAGLAGSAPAQVDLAGGSVPIPGRFGWCRYYGTYGLANGAVRLCPTPLPQQPTR